MKTEFYCHILRYGVCSHKRMLFAVCHKTILQVFFPMQECMGLLQGGARGHSPQLALFLHYYLRIAIDLTGVLKRKYIPSSTLEDFPWKTYTDLYQ